MRRMAPEKFDSKTERWEPGETEVELSQEVIQRVPTQQRTFLVEYPDGAKALFGERHIGGLEKR